MDCPRLNLPRVAGAALATLALALPCAAPAAAANDWPAQSSDVQKVTVRVVPRVLSGSAWEFEVTFDTHVRALDDDLMRSATLVDGQGKPHGPTAWKGDGPGSHHRKGVLVFAALDPRPQSIELRIQRPGEPAPRVFKWQAP